MALRWIVVLSLLTSATGCWMESCDFGTSCEERLSGLLDDPEERETWCGADLQLRSCEDLGYTVECDGIWYRTEDAVYACQ